MSKKGKTKKRTPNEKDQLTPYRRRLVKEFWGNEIATVYDYYETFRRPKEELLKTWQKQMTCPSGKK